MNFECFANGQRFEILDDWLSTAGIADFHIRPPHYDSSADAKIVLIEDLVPPCRDNDKIWFRNKDDVVRLLVGMRTRVEIPPVEVWSLEKKKSSRWIIKDGFHRFYLSVALGYTHIPIKIDDFDMGDFFGQ